MLRSGAMLAVNVCQGGVRRVFFLLPNAKKVSRIIEAELRLLLRGGDSMSQLRGFTSKILRAFPMMPLVALGFMLAWTKLAYGGAAWVSVEIDTMNLYTISPLSLYSMLGFSIAAALCASFAWRVGRWLNTALFPLVGGIVMAGASLGIILLGPCVLGSLLPPTIARGICYSFYALTGIGMVPLTLACGKMYGSIPPRSAIVQTAASILVMESIYFIVLGAPAWRINGQGPTYFGAGAFVLLPLIAALFAVLPRIARSQEEPTEYLEERSAIPKPFWKLLGVVLVLSFAVSAANGYIAAIAPVSQVITDSSLALMFYGVVALVFGFMAIGLDASRFRLGRVYSVVMAISAMVVACIPLAEFAGLNWGGIVGLAIAIFDFVFRCMLAFIVYQKHLSPVLVFGYGAGVYMLGGSVGWFVGAQVIPAVVETHEFIPFFVLALVALASVFVLFSEHDFDLVFESTETDEEKALSDLMKKEVRAELAAIGPHSPRGKFKIAVDVIADDYALSRREKEVLRYLAMGYESTYIAEKMGVSWNTVRTHTRNLYGKLDVHSKQDAVALVDDMVESVSL